VELEVRSGPGDGPGRVLPVWGSWAFVLVYKGKALITTLDLLVFFFGKIATN
jgi:hypothetical protein